MVVVVVFHTQLLHHIDAFWNLGDVTTEVCLH